MILLSQSDMGLLIFILVLTVVGILICLIFLIYKIFVDNAEKKATSQKKLFVAFKPPVKKNERSRKKVNSS